MSRKSPAFQFYPDSWLSSTDICLMSPSEEGAYIRLLCHAWLQPDCGLPADDESLAQLSRLGRAWKSSRPRIICKFNEIDGRIFNHRLLVEREKQKEWAEKSANGGRKSASNRQANGNHPCGLVDGDSQPTEQPNANTPSPSSFPSPESQPLFAADAAPGKIELGKIWYDRAHDLWYSGYWCHVGRNASRKAFEKRVKILSKSITDPVRYLCDERDADRARFEPTREWDWRSSLHPATWLNGERWNDQPSSQTGAKPAQRDRALEMAAELERKLLAGGAR